jgi:hypothetical protein
MPAGASALPAEPRRRHHVDPQPGRRPRRPARRGRRTIRSNKHTLGALCVYGDRVEDPEDTLIGLLSGLARQVGQYLQCRRAEELTVELAHTKDEFLALVTQVRTATCFGRTRKHVTHYSGRAGEVGTKSAASRRAT